MERHWGDVHASLVVTASTQLNRQMRGPLRSRVDERQTVSSSDSETSRIILPVRARRAQPAALSEAFSFEPPANAAEPALIELVESEIEFTTYVKVIDPSSEGALVTVIEFLSSAEKEPRKVRSADQYHARREELRLGGVSLVEVDLLHDSERFFPEYADRYGKCLPLRPVYILSRTNSGSVRFLRRLLERLGHGGLSLCRSLICTFTPTIPCSMVPARFLNW